MLPQDEVDKMRDCQLRKAIADRYLVLPTLVGWLYPSIIQDEIHQLQKALNDSSQREPTVCN